MSVSAGMRESVRAPAARYVRGILATLAAGALAACATTRPVAPAAAPASSAAPAPSVATAPAARSTQASASDVNARGPDGSTALMWAAHRGDVAAVARLIHDGASVSLVSHYGASAMSEAASMGNAAIIKLLLAAGADVDSANPGGETALMEVARTGHVEAAELLLRHGATVDARERWGGQTALMWAAAQSQPEMVKLLITHHADVNARAVVRDWQRRVTAEGRPKDMRHGGLTPLLFAARENCIACVKELLAGGADINLPDPDGVTPLEMALLNLHWDLARELILAGADVNAWDFWGQSPIYVAVDMNTLPRGGRADLPSTDRTTGIEVIEQLLDRGADPNLQLKLAPPLRHAILDRGADPMLTIGATPLLRAAQAADLPAMRVLLAHGALVDLPNFDGETPLLVAAGAGRNKRTTRGALRTEAQAIAAYELLRDHGANVHAANRDGETAMHSAALRGWNRLVAILAHDGVALDTPAASGLTPLDFAMGRYKPGFLEPKPTPNLRTAALLKQLGARAEHTHLPKWPGVPTPTITAQVPQLLQ